MPDVFECVHGSADVFDQPHVDLATDRGDLGRITTSDGRLDTIQVESRQASDVGHRLVLIPAAVGVDLDAGLRAGCLSHDRQSLFVEVDVDTHLELESRKPFGTLFGDFLAKQLQVIADEGHPRDMDPVSPLTSQQTAHRGAGRMTDQVVADHVESGAGQSVQR